MSGLPFWQRVWGWGLSKGEGAGGRQKIKWGVENDFTEVWCVGGFCGSSMGWGWERSPDIGILKWPFNLLKERLTRGGWVFPLFGPPAIVNAGVEFHWGLAMSSPGVPVKVCLGVWGVCCWAVGACGVCQGVTGFWVGVALGVFGLGMRLGYFLWGWGV